MKGIRRAGLLFIILMIGIFVGRLDYTAILLITSPLALLWFMNWDEKRYRKMIKQNKKVIPRSN
ncbi:hypothetical protein [Enterococcus timonensis]|uniref:hypothetical protein n=1 Tax=Enterococcus timonensis TaxID=1852364 RepID=UPI0008D9EA32|nr:hypothetical protein [Enterococcus timonensis]